MLRATIIIITIIFAATLNVLGQQDVTFSQYTFDKLLINPAYAGSSKWMVGSIKNRTIISEIEGLPQSNLISFQAPLQAKNIGVGLKVIQDKIAVTNRIMATALFSYHIGFGNGKLSFGLEGGFINSNFKYSDLERIVIDDPAIPPGDQSAFIPDFTTGVFYHSEKFYIGGSVSHLLDSKKEIPNYSKNQFYSQEKNYYLTGGYYFEIDRDIILEPGFLVKYVKGAPLQTDINILFTMIDKFTTGISYRTGDAIMILLKVDVTKNIKIQYSYDYTLSDLTNYSSGNHEFALSYGIELLPPPSKKVIHPRYYF